MKKLFNDPSSKKFRQKLRNNMPKPEQKLWYFLRKKQLNNIKFRLQVSIGKYVVDFYSFEKKLVIEIDGNSHFINDKSIKKDKIRSDFLESEGLEILRFTDDDVMQNVEACVEKILEYLDSV